MEAGDKGADLLGCPGMRFYVLSERLCCLSFPQHMGYLAKNCLLRRPQRASV